MGGRFEWLNRDMNDIFTKLYSSQNLCKLLYYDVDDPLSQPDLVDTTILYTDKTNQRLIPRPFMLDDTKSERSFMTIEFDRFRMGHENVLTKDSVIIFNILSHLYLWDIIDSSGEIKERPFMIMHEIDLLFNRERTVGLGKNNWLSSNRLFINGTNFCGFTSVYSVYDFT